jgi:hypothetical protein
MPKNRTTVAAASHVGARVCMRHSGNRNALKKARSTVNLACVCELKPTDSFLWVVCVRSCEITTRQLLSGTRSIHSYACCQAVQSNSTKKTSPSAGLAKRLHNAPKQYGYYKQRFPDCGGSLNITRGWPDRANSSAQTREGTNGDCLRAAATK